MTQKELIERMMVLVAKDPRRTNISKSGIGIVLEALAAVAATELAGDGEVPLPGLGKLVAVERKARTGRNPQTGAAIKIAACRTVKFNPGKILKTVMQA